MVTVKKSDLDVKVTVSGCVKAAQIDVPNMNELWYKKIERIAGLAYLEAKAVIEKNNQSKESYEEAAKVIRVAIEAVNQQVQKAETVHKARRDNHRSTKDVRMAIVTGEQVMSLLESYMGQLIALIESRDISEEPGMNRKQVIESAINSWINRINSAVDEKYIAEESKDWDAVYEGSSAALQLVSLDGYIFRYLKTVEALKLMLSTAKTSNRIVELAADLNRLMERCQLAYVDVISARKALIKLNKAEDDEPAGEQNKEGQ